METISEFGSIEMNSQELANLLDLHMPKLGFLSSKTKHVVFTNVAKSAQHYANNSDIQALEILCLLYMKNKNFEKTANYVAQTIDKEAPSKAAEVLINAIIDLTDLLSLTQDIETGISRPELRDQVRKKWFEGIVQSVCQNCGEEFVAPRKGLIYCSVKCQIEWESDLTVPL